ASNASATPRFKNFIFLSLTQYQPQKLPFLAIIDKYVFRIETSYEAGEHGAPAGDLYVQVQVKQHPIFEREGNNLYCEVPINFAMA
ncbi:hypothetical protein ONJ17_26160, partial [Salmonella enterica subsp. enterica serovar Agona]|nr:hypothetical protein [Salmonella enterica subsp. enterica serovar Agona]